MSTILVTPTETTLIAELEKKGVAFKKENLLVGDIHVCHGETPVYIIERKAKGDLLASIKDGRYHEQKSRLFQTGLEPQRIIYLIEGLTNPSKVEWGAICNTQYRDHCALFQTRNVGETVDYIYHLSQSVEKFYEDTSNPINVKIKKKSCAAEDWYKTALTLIPKVSENVASVIVEKYPKLSNLKNAIEVEGHKAISELKFGGSSRRIGDKLSKEICQYINLNW